jgi:hypothetical protein
MRQRYRLAFPLSALVLVLGAAVANASKPAPTVEPLSPESVHQMQLGQTPAPNSTCQLGVTDPPAWIINYLLPPDDAYYNLVNPANCACAAGAVQLTDIKIYLNFQAACSQPVVISVVAAVPGPTGCPTPDPSNNLCVPLSYNLAPGAPGNYIFTLPLPTGCCINGPAFIGINFIAPGPGCDQNATRPRLVTTNICNPCVSYNIFPGGFDDLCVDIGLPGNVAMFADADCCGATPTHGSTWGRVKVLYR